MSDSVLDLEELIERFDEDMEFLEESIDMLKEDSPRLLQEIEDGLQSGDADKVYRAGHGLKGAIANFCAPRATQAAFHVEQIGKFGELAKGNEAYSHLQSELEHLYAALDAVVQGKPNS